MEDKKVTLSDGRVALIKKGKGKDLFEAQRLASDPSEIQKLLLSRLTEIDNKSINEFDLEEMDLSDLVLLLDSFSQMHPKSLTPKV